MKRHFSVGLFYTDRVIHTRVLIGKAFERRFRKFLPQLEGVETKADELTRLREPDYHFRGITVGGFAR